MLMNRARRLLPASLGLAGILLAGSALASMEATDRNAFVRTETAHGAAAEPAPTKRGYYAFQVAQTETSDESNLEDLGLDDLEQQEDLSDPIEGLNRFFFAITDMVDTIALRPLAGLYSFVAPEPMKKSIRQLVRNVASPRRLGNKLLQGEFEGAGIVLGRVLVNTTVGVGGLFEVAEDWGLPKQNADFGQTLSVWGLPPGPHISVPVLGPHSARHAVGRVGDTLMDPLFWLAPTAVTLPLTATNLIATREALIEPLDELRASSVDFYSALRSAYWQNRLKQLRDEPSEFDLDFDGGPQEQEGPQN